MHILIKGLGWYGCHAAITLKSMGITFKICDITNDFFTGSSSKNQNRLHQSFHYSRSYSTRKECCIGFNKFMEKYKQFTCEIPKNYYCVDKTSIIDYETYKAIYSYEKADFIEQEDFDLEFKCNKNMFDGIITVNERFIDFRKAKQYFKEELSEFMLDFNTYNENNYDMIIDCTFTPITSNTFQEQCISLLYEYIGPKTNTFAITVMDGLFWSLYPYDIVNNIYTLTDVEFTPIGKESVKDDMELKVTKYIPDFDKHFIYKGCFYSHKIKSNNSKTDDRSLMYKIDNKILKFCGGKITGIFTMENILRDYFKTV